MKHFVNDNERILSGHENYIEFQVPHAEKEHLDEKSLYMDETILKESGFDNFWIECIYNDIVFDKDTISKEELSAMMQVADKIGGVVAEIMSELCLWTDTIELKNKEYISICTKDEIYGTDKQQ